jgi:hypothetical protein
METTQVVRHGIVLPGVRDLDLLCPSGFSPRDGQCSRLNVNAENRDNVRTDRLQEIRMMMQPFWRAEKVQMLSWI